MSDTTTIRAVDTAGRKLWRMAMIERGMMAGTSWSLRSLLLLALLLPVAIAGWFSWYQYRAILDEVHSGAQRSVVALVEHADNVLQAHSLILGQVATLTDGKTWDQIANDKQLQQSLAGLTSNFEQVSIIAIADAQGRIRASSLPRSADTSIADRDYFIAHKSGRHEGAFFGQAFTGKLSGKRQFAISVARTNAAGAFDGVIFTAVPLAYFTDFWRQFAPSDGYLIPLIRDDGILMVRYPALNSPERLNPKGPFVSHIKQSPRGSYTAVSQVDGIERINTYSQIKGFPLYISFSIEKRTALEKWWHSAWIAFGVATAVSAAMIALLMLVIRQTYRQRTAARKWREVADRLEREVARREEAEEALRHGQKMEAIGQLTGGIAHDFNNLLAGISGNLELTRIRLEQGKLGDACRHIDAAETVLDRAASITQRLLAFSRRQTLSPKPTSTNERIRSMQELIQRTVGPAIEVQTVLADDCWNTVCDPNQLDSALLNLAINARDAMPEGGQLTIATSNTVLDGVGTSTGNGLPPGKYVTITVTDCGTGMPPEVLQRAFDPFFTTKPLGQGTGLGLSMVYGFVKQSGGEVRINSALHVGTSVRIYLPAFDVEIPEEQGSSALTATHRLADAVTIVLAEDESPLRNLLSEVLGDAGYKVMAVPDGVAALRILESEAQIDLLITDVGLPGTLNGKRLADAGRALRSKLMVLYITGYVPDAGADQGFLEGGAEVMTKPFKLNEFMHRVAALAHKNASATQV